MLNSPGIHFHVSRYLILNYLTSRLPARALLCHSSKHKIFIQRRSNIFDVGPKLHKCIMAQTSQTNQQLCRVLWGETVDLQAWAVCVKHPLTFSESNWSFFSKTEHNTAGGESQTICTVWDLFNLLSITASFWLSQKKTHPNPSSQLSHRSQRSTRGSTQCIFRTKLGRLPRNTSQWDET